MKNEGNQGSQKAAFKKKAKNPKRKLRSFMNPESNLLNPPNPLDSAQMDEKTQNEAFIVSILSK